MKGAAWNAAQERVACEGMERLVRRHSRALLATQCDVCAEGLGASELLAEYVSHFWAFHPSAKATSALIRPYAADERPSC